MPWWPFTSSSSSSPPNPSSSVSDSASQQPPKPPPNLNSPPGMPMPYMPPSTSNISPASTTMQQTTEPQQLETAPAAQSSTAQNRRLFYYSAVGIAAACPIVALMPPRKFDLFTFGLGIAFCASTGFVLEEKTSKGLVWHVGSRIPSQANADRRARERIEREGPSLSDMVREDERRLREAREKEKRGLVKRVWMGEERDDWVQDRKRREDEALSDGRGYGGLIADYVAEGLGFKKADGDGDDDGEDGEEEKRS